MSTFDLNPIYGTHAPVLEYELCALPADSLVIEHGPGVYSTPVLCRHDVRVLVVEPLPGWAGWAKWMYGGKCAGVAERGKAVLDKLAGCSLLFIDGPARDRGPLLGWALERRLPVIIAHDTEEDTLDRYLYTRAHFRAAGYDVTHHGERPRTTLWKLRS